MFIYYGLIVLQYFQVQILLLLLQELFYLNQIATRIQQVKMQVLIKIPFKNHQIAITNKQSMDFNISCIPELNKKNNQTKEEDDKIQYFIREVKQQLECFARNIQKIKQSTYQQSINSFNQEINQTCQNLLPYLIKKNSNLSSESLNLSQQMQKLSDISNQNNLNWRNQQQLEKVLQKTIYRLNNQISEINQEQSFIVQLKKQIQSNPKLQQDKQILAQKQHKIEKKKQNLSNYFKKLTFKISQVIKKKQNEATKIKRSKIKKDFFQEKVAQLYLVHELSLPITEIQQLKNFNCTILKQIYLCGNQIGNNGFKSLTQINLINLKILDLQFNGISNIQQISKFNYLQELYLADCECTNIKQSINLITLKHACSVFSHLKKQTSIKSHQEQQILPSRIKWENLRCLSINFAKQQDQFSKNEVEFAKYWQPALIKEFLETVILQDNKENFPKLEKVQYWCAKCFKKQYFKKSYAETQNIFRIKQIQFKQID